MPAEFYVIHARKNQQNTQIFMIFDRKINKIPEFYMIFFIRNVAVGIFQFDSSG